MGAKENLVGNIKSIMHVPGRVMLGDRASNYNNPALPPGLEK
jgi:hypothetical protein